MEVGLLSEESRINSTEISLITVCDTHLYTNSNGDSCPQFLIMVAGHSEVGFSWFGNHAGFVFINWMSFLRNQGFFWHFFKYMYQSGNHVLPLPLLKIVVTLSKLGKLLYMYEFILSHTKISQMCMCKSVYYQVSLNCRPRFWKGNFKKKIFPFDLSWRLKRK